MRYGSLFSGIGGLDLALEAFGHEPAWFCEKEPACIAVLERQWPGVPIYTDIREMDESVERVPLMAGGYPCQGFSGAGLRKGVTDDRYLWPEFFRLIRLLRPRHAIIENVYGHLSLGFDQTLYDLASVGFDADWDDCTSVGHRCPPSQRTTLLPCYGPPEQFGGDHQRRTRDSYRLRW